MNHSHDPDEVLLRSRGERLTPQRLMTLNVLRTHSGHLSAEHIHQQIQQQHPYVSVATVYRTLQWLQEHGLVSVIDLGGGRNYYEYRGDEPHHHLVCTRCEAVTEIDDSVLESLKQQLLDRYGFTPQLDHLAMTGICQHCRTPQEARIHP